MDELLTEDRKGQGLLLHFALRRDITFTDMAKLSRWGLLQPAVEREAASAAGDGYAHQDAVRYELVGNFSGGNQQKVVIAKWLFRGSKILICDEPTRGIDVGAKRRFTTCWWELAATGKGVIFVSSIS